MTYCNVNQGKEETGILNRNGRQIKGITLQTVQWMGSGATRRTGSQAGAWEHADFLQTDGFQSTPAFNTCSS